MSAALPPAISHTTLHSIREIAAYLGHLSRLTAGAQSLDLSLRSHRKELDDGERIKGLPIFEFSAPSLDPSGGAVKCVIDLKHVDHRHVEMVLIPIINSYLGEMAETVVELDKLFQTVRKDILAAAGTPPT